MTHEVLQCFRSSTSSHTALEAKSFEATTKKKKKHVRQPTQMETCDDVLAFCVESLFIILRITLAASLAALGD
jgi:archaellum biogenesis ATPase FlaH